MQETRCRVCGGTIVPKSPHKSGRQPELCSAECRKANRKAYYSGWHKRNRDEVAQKRKSIRHKLHEWNKGFYARHKERRKAQRREYYARNREKTLAANRKYAEANPELISRISGISNTTRRARLKGVFIEAVDPQVVFDRDKGICGICGQPIGDSEWHIDHVIPIAKGGSHSYANVQLAHAMCNWSKGDKILQTTQVSVST